jgi:hypothetical protein
MKRRWLDGSKTAHKWLEKKKQNYASAYFGPGGGSQFECYLFPTSGSYACEYLRLVCVWAMYVKDVHNVLFHTCKALTPQSIATILVR